MGQNSAYGVIQMRTKSPFDSPGDVVMLGAEEKEISFKARSVTQLSSTTNLPTRYLPAISRAVSGKIPSPLEPDMIVLRTPGPEGDVILTDSIPNTPHDNLKNLSADFRLDYRHSSRLGLQLSGGLTRSDFLDVTQQGRLQGANFPARIHSG